MNSRNYSTFTKHDCLKMLFWIKQVYPIVFFSSFVYVSILFLNLCGVYSMKNDNPIIILGYISLVHFFSYPLFQFGMNGNTVCLLMFPYINLVWIVAVVIGHFVLFALFHDDAVKLNVDVPIHYYFTASYFLASLILELLLIFFKTQEMKSIKVDLETLESEEIAKNDKFSDKLSPTEKDTTVPEKMYHTITIVNQNPPTEEYLKELHKDAPDEVNSPKSPQKEFAKLPLPKFVIDRQSKLSNPKEQAGNLIETQNSIRNLLNKKPDNLRRLN